MTPAAAVSHRVSFHIVWISVALGLFLLTALVLCGLWMAREIDGAALNEQKIAVATAIEDAGRRMQLEQSTAANRKDSVFYSTNGQSAWVPKGLAEWTSREFGHDRVYVFYRDGAVLQASAQGRQIETAIRPEDQEALAAISAQVQVSLLTSAPHARPVSQCCLAIRRLGDGALAFVSVRVLRQTDSTDRNPLLLASIGMLDAHGMAGIAQRLGLTGLKTVRGSISPATIALRDEQHRPLGYVQWTAPSPAATLVRQAALPAVIGVLMVGACIFFLLGWLRRTSLRLEASQRRASFLAMHDPLTGAANRALFDQRLREALQYQTLSETKVLLVALDLDRFKEINDTHGHAAGDELLREVGRRLLVELPEEATLARLGGDEFAIVQPGIVSDGHARWMCQRLLKALSHPVVLTAASVRITVSMGLAVELPNAVSPQELARRADVALYASKKDGRDRSTLYDPAMDAVRRDRLTLDVDLRNALLRDELELAYQPIFTARDGAIAGVEALVRWSHPTRGPISPEYFIALAEETGIIDDLGLWVLRRAVAFARTADLASIAVNVSPVQFNRLDFPDQVLQVLAETGLSASRLELEITEGVVLQSSAPVQEALRRLRAAGVRIAIDDFGAGYASISYLRSYPIDKLKIDRSLIRRLGEDEATTHIVKAIIDMATAMKLSTTAEGVENESQRRMLAGLGCSQLQGYLLARPAPADQVVAMLATAQPRQARA